jgi:hypothetical protein
MSTESQEKLWKLKWLPAAMAIVAFIACNGVFLIVAMLSLFGIVIVVNPHIQAAVISLFAVLTLTFVFVGYRRHYGAGPMILSAIGAVLVVGSMYIYFNKVVESLGLLALIASAVWSWRVSRARAATA